MSMNLARRAAQTSPRTSFVRGYAMRPLPRPKDPLSTSSHASVTQITSEVTFIHRPPPSAPSPLSYTTAPASPLLRAAPEVQNASAQPPPLRLGNEQQPTYHLTSAQIEEMRQLRAADPKKNSVMKLAEKYDCSRLFVSMVAPLSKTAKEQKEAQLERQRARWGENKQMSREIRRKRRSMW